MCVPAIVVALVWHTFGVSIAGFRPASSDEVWYWHQTLTFASAGFHGGYYTQGELTNPSGLTPFGPHGPGFPVLYGLAGRAFGWHAHSAVALNVTVIGAAAWWCIAVAGVGAGRAGVLALLLTTFWPLLFWAPTAMQESLHHAGAVALAGCVAGVLGGTHRRWALWGGWLLLPLLAFVRPSWLVTMPIWALVTAWRRPPVVRAVALTGAVAAAVVVFEAYSHTVAPFVPPFFFLRIAGTDVAVHAIANNLVANLRMTVSPGDYEAFEVVHRLQYWLWLPASFAAVAMARAADDRAARPYLVAGVGATAAALGVMLVLYTLTNNAEHRVLSAFLLFAVVLAAMAPGRVSIVLVGLLIASNIATAGVFTTAFREERQANFVWDARGQRELAVALAGRVAFRPGESRWCNTLLASQFPPFLAVVPAGIGISLVREQDQVALPVKSRYLLLDERAIADFRAPLRIQPLATLPYGTLYLNLDAQCG